MKMILVACHPMRPSVGVERAKVKAKFGKLEFFARERGGGGLETYCFDHVNWYVGKWSVGWTPTPCGMVNSRTLMPSNYRLCR